jgi:uncharacterized membrane protein YeaQ/YmgE (transglycosylase-associated protein family)
VDRYGWAYLIVAVVGAVLLDWLILQLRHRSTLVPAVLARLRATSLTLPGWVKAQAMQVFHDLGLIGRSAAALIKQQWTTPIQALRASMVGGALFVSLSLGWVYSHATFVHGWQLWLWLL